MSTSVGTLTIEMAANIVRLQQDMDKARSAVENTMGKISKAAGAAGVALGALGVTVGVGAFAGWIRGAIDAADETTKLAQKIGVAVPQVAGLQLAFRQSGIDAGALQTSMSKLSVAIADGNDAFVAMNISTKNADGTLKNTRQILGEVADKFQDYEDGAAKTALAIKLFGKAGADLIPLLNGGAEALDEFDAMAKKLGLTLDEDTAKRAERFNDTLDLMGQGFTGIGRQVAAQLLPTLEGLADQFFSSMTEGDRLRVIGDALSKGLKALYIVGVALVGAFKAVGDTLYAVGAQAMAVMRGDFAGAVKIGKQYASDMQNNWTGSLEEIDKAWNANGSTAVSTMAATTKAFKTQAPVVNDETKKMAAETAKLEDAYKKLIDSIENKTEVMIAESEGTGKLTDGQKIALKMMQDLQNGTLKLTDEQKRNLTATLELMLKTEQKIAVDKDLAETQLRIIKLSDQLVDAQQKETAALFQGNEKLREQNDVLRLGQAAVTEREIAVLRATATDLEFSAATFEGNEELAKQAKLLRERADLMENNTVLQEAKNMADEYKKTSEAIESSLTDALMRGFESGKDFGKNLADTLVNLFKTLVLKPIIQPIAQGGANMLLSMMGMSLPGSAAGGGGVGAGGGMMSGLALSMSTFGSYLGTGFMNTIMGTGGGATFTAAGSMFGTGQTAAGLGMGAGALAAYAGGALVGVGAGRAISNGYAVSGTGKGIVNAGTAVGMVLGGPIGAAIGGAIAGVVNRAFGRKQTDMGIEGSLTTTGGIEGESYRFMKGGYFRSDDLGKDPLPADIEAVFDESIELISKQTRNYATALGLPSNAIDVMTQKIKLSFQGLNEEQINQKIAEALADFQLLITIPYSDALNTLRITGETLMQTLERLVAIQDVSIYLNEFGGAFTNFATASVTARQSIIDLAGGMEALVQKTQGFVSNFYTQEEQLGMTAKGLVQTLSLAGFSTAQIAALDTKADFRKLLESLDPETQQKQFVALLDVQQSFAGLSSTLEEQQTSLFGLIEAAPQVEILQKMFETDAEFQDRLEEADYVAQQTFDNILKTMGQVDFSIKALTDITATKLDFLATQMEISNAERNAAAINAIAVAQLEAAIIRDRNEAAANALALEPYYGGGFASGGMYKGGMAMVGEHGPELINFGAPGQVYTASATANMMGGGEVAAEIRALRDEVSLMRAETRATAVNTSKIVKLQDNWDVRGLTVKTDADQPLDTVTV
jgi:hypothetical protein